jgi:hypothetical protein
MEITGPESAIEWMRECIPSTMPGMLQASWQRNARTWADEFPLWLIRDDAKRMRMREAVEACRVASGMTDADARRTLRINPHAIVAQAKRRAKDADDAERKRMS